ncbi:hypothetical protein IMZ48_31630 [Candidatus Bathyarchaeota archaeon]|nr:hypothetical protein [Candidatus Bathyarchaeota archaeon]
MLVLTLDYQRTDVLGAMSDAISSSNETWILTDFQLNDDAGIAVVGEYRRVAKRLPFISVVLRCERGEHLRRAAETGKLDEVKGLLEVEYGEDIYYFRDGNRRELDVTHLVPGEAARRIHAFVNGVITAAGSGS